MEVWNKMMRLKVNLEMLCVSKKCYTWAMNLLKLLFVLCAALVLSKGGEFMFCLLLQEQYEFCHEMVLAYMAEFETYANFR